MYDSFFMGKPTSYWLELDNKFGDIKDDPYMLLVAAEAKLELLACKYEKDKHNLHAEIDRMKLQLGYNSGK